MRISAVIFDLGGVLFGKSTHLVAQRLPKRALCLRWMRCRGVRQLQRDFFLMLDRLFPEPEPESAPTAGAISTVLPEPQQQPPFQQVLAPSYEGKRIPWILVRWMANQEDASWILRRIAQHLRTPESMEEIPPTATCFHGCIPYANTWDRELMMELACVTFDPLTLAAVMEPIDEGLRLVRDLVRHRSVPCSGPPEETEDRTLEASGLGEPSPPETSSSPPTPTPTPTPPLRLYLLSNFQTEALRALWNRFPDTFQLFDGILVSGMVHHVKPSPAIFEAALQRWHLDPRQCIFLDDATENVLAAQRQGMLAVEFRKDNIGPIRRMLQRHFLLPPETLGQLPRVHQEME